METEIKGMKICPWLAIPLLNPELNKIYDNEMYSETT